VGQHTHSNLEAYWTCDCAFDGDSVAGARPRPPGPAARAPPGPRRPQLKQIQAARGGTVDDGSVAADKPLAVILSERKAEKDAAFQEQWRQMKTGGRAAGLGP
jgi:hypothetical protein